MNPIFRRHLARRTFLRGAGATLALPFLDAMRPAFARAASVAPPVRLAFAYVPNGIIMPDWTPAQEGRAYAFTRILKPLEPLRDDVLVLSGLAHHNANELGDGPGDHARAAACFLTGVHAKKTAGADIRNGVSADQIVAQALAAETRLPSLELGCEESRTVGNCDSGYSCAYTNSISWRAATTPMPPETNPRLAFERLFGDADNADPAARAQRARERTSILDVVGERSRELMGQLGTADRRKLDEYQYAVREIERQIQRAETDTRPVVPPIEKPSGIPETFAEYLRLMYELQVIAFQADLTRVATLMVGREGSLQSYPEIGVPDPHHPLTHHQNNPDWVEKVTRINVHHMELFAHFVSRLKATPDGDGTLLDHSMVVYGSAIADGNKHTHESLPVLLAGGGGGAIKSGRHVAYAKETPLTNLYLTLLDRMGVRPETIGDSTGRIEHLSEI
ncbi:MAG TPA: DUF1552 domain-containing protein [Vicinamibacteria bacterium]|nr:DUF1552 domain-containing protein [Vicinamibacteria bacterium]